MPRLSKEFKQAISEIPVEELQKLVMQFASKNPEIYDFINLQYVNGTDAEDELFEETTEKISDEILFLGERGIVQKNLAKAITKSVGYINYVVEYREPLNRFLNILHSRSNHLDYVFHMPKSIE